MFSSCLKSGEILMTSLDEVSLLEGTSDVIVVKHKSGEYRSSRFFVSFGTHAIDHLQGRVQVLINNTEVRSVEFYVNRFGYLSPSILTTEHLRDLELRFGRNDVEYKLGEVSIRAQIYLYADNDRLLISDVDGTLTKSDVVGLYSNYMEQDYLHDGYHELTSRVSENGYKVVWMTMRSLPLYNFSKKYIRSHVKIEGPLLMEPEEFFHAFKKEITSNAANVKANLLKEVRTLFPLNINPFIGGLGNRDTDAIAYMHSNIPAENIYIINKNSEVHKLDNKEHNLTYPELVNDIESHFPAYWAPKVCYQ